MGAFREILITVAGLTPQIITETLYYLTQIEQPPVKISKIFVLTTLVGRDRIRKSLLEPSSGHFWAFLQEYGLDPSAITFDAQSIIVLKGNDGQPLVDIRTDADNETVADQILEFIRQQTADPETRLHCSIAGGRKTQALYLGFALQLYGRPQDHLLHVLVSEEFESHREFFYPPKTPRQLRTAAGRLVDTREAHVELAQIPFVRLRDKLPGGVGAFKPTISSLQVMLDLLPHLPAVRIELRQRRLVIGDVAVPLEPMQIVLYAHLARASQGAALTTERLTGVGETGYLSLTDLDTQRDALLSRYGEVYGSHSEMYKRLSKRWERAIDADTIRMHFAKINRKIRQAVQDEAKALHYIVTSVGAYGDTR